MMTATIKSTDPMGSDEEREKLRKRRDIERGTLKALIINRSVRVLIERSWLDYWAVTDGGLIYNLQSEMATTGNITINVRNFGDLISIDDGLKII